MNKKIIHSVFDCIADIYPAHTAVKEERRTICYRDLKINANRLAHFLSTAGVGKGDNIGVLLPAGIGLVEALLATFKAGAIYLPLDLAFSSKRFSDIFSQCLPAVVITNSMLYPAFRTKIAELNLPVSAVLIHDGGDSFKYLSPYTPAATAGIIPVTGFPEENPVMISEADDGNYIVYTSGSTGMGKAILGCHKSLSHFIHWELKEFIIDAGIRVGQLSQITFDASFRDIFVPLCSGGTICVPSADTKNNPAKLLEWLDGERINIIHCVPSLFRTFNKALAGEKREPARLKCLKFIFMAGEPLYAKDITAWRETIGTHVELINLYGTSESTLAKTFHRIKEVPEIPSAIIHAGKPIDNTIVAIIRDGLPCHQGEIGDVYIKTPFITKGYFKDEIQTKAIFVPNPLTNDPMDIFHRTGDLGRWLEDGNIEILGRLDDQVKINGIRVELGEIKEAMLSMIQIRETEILVNKDAGSNELIGYFVGETTPHEVREYLKNVLNGSMIPAYLIPLKEFPLNIHGKVDRKALPKPVEVLFTEQAYEAVVNDYERKVEQIWKDVLMQEMIGRKISFFRIGGTSIKAMQVISRIYRELGVNIKLADFFNAPDIERLSLLIRENEKKVFDEILPVPEQTSCEATQAQKDLWVMDHFKAAKNVYNMFNACRIQGPLDVDLFKAALAAVIDRYESLRTTFVLTGDNPEQKIHADFNIGACFQYIKLPYEGDNAAEIDRLINEELLNGFDLEKGPLLRVKLIWTGQQEHISLLTIHHIIADGWSLEILNRDLLHYYSFYSSGTNLPLAPLKIQYKDYSHWLNGQLKGEKREKLENYWSDKLKGELPVLQFSPDYHRPREMSFKGSLLSFKLDGKLSSRLRGLAAGMNVTLFMLLNAIINVLLYKYTGTKDLLTGSPFSGRMHKDLEDQVGLFVNIVLLRIELDENDTFARVLEKNKEEILNAWLHQLYPFNCLAALLNYQLPENRFPFVNILTQSQNSMMNIQPAANGNIHVTPYDTPHLTSKVDITFNFTDGEDAMGFIIEYRTDLFKRSTIDNLKENICYIARSVIEDINLPLSEVRLIRTREEDLEADSFKRMMYDL